MLSKQLNCTPTTTKKHIKELQEMQMLVPTSKGWYEVVGNMRFKAISNSVGITCINVKEKYLNNKADFLSLIKLAKIQAASLGLQKIEDKKAQKQFKKKKKKKDESISGISNHNSSEASKEAEQEHALSAAVSSKAVSKVINAFGYQRGFSEASVRKSLVKAKKNGLVSYKRQYKAIKCDNLFTKFVLGLKNIEVKINYSDATARDMKTEFARGFIFRQFKEKDTPEINPIIEAAPKKGNSKKASKKVEEKPKEINENDCPTVFFKRGFGESAPFLWAAPNGGYAIATETVSKKEFDKKILSKSYHEKKYKKAVQKYGLGTLNYGASKKHFITELDKANRTAYFIRFMNKAKGRA